MPTYIYETIPQNDQETPDCFEAKQSIHDAPLTQHPEDGRPVRRVIVGGNLLMKGAPATSAHTHSGGCGCGPSGCC